MPYPPEHASPTLSNLKPQAQHGETDGVTEFGGSAFRADAKPAPPAALSLSALFEGDQAAATRRILEARRTEPFNPLHDFRGTLHFLRYGQLDQALQLLANVQRALPNSSLPEYVRGLILIRAGRADQARNIGEALSSEHPDFYPAKFLRAEAQILAARSLKRLKKILSPLPTESEHESLWADLLAKVVLIFPGQTKVVRSFADKVISDGGPSRAAIDQALAWSEASADELVEALVEVDAGSRAEQIILSLINDRIDTKAAPDETTRIFERMRRRCPERGAVRQIYTHHLTEIAADYSRSKQYPSALRMVERCLNAEPHGTVHYQNRAALFTLLKELKPYHDAWADLDRHQYRLALLGKIDKNSVAQLIRPHRLFAQAARFGTKSAIFSEHLEDGLRKITHVDSESITKDPDLLRQWIHHRRAELFFLHWALDDNAERFLLFPEDRDDALLRLDCLGVSGASLAVLGGEEGALLSERLMRRWQRLAEEVQSRYTKPEEDTEVTELKREYIVTLGDLTLLSAQWEPQADALDAAEEVLELLAATKYFFDEQLLLDIESQPGTELPYPMLILLDKVKQATGADLAVRTPLTRAQRESLIERIKARFLFQMSLSAYDSQDQKDSSVERALTLIDRARACDPESATIQMVAARFLVVGGYFREARDALGLVNRLMGADDRELQDEVEELERILAARAREKVEGRSRVSQDSTDIAMASRFDRVAALEEELDRYPTSIHVYEEIAHELIAVGQLDEAQNWSQRAIAHCLVRANQIRARMLDMEVKGLCWLMSKDSQAVQVYIAGSRAAAKEALEHFCVGEDVAYSALFLLGQCQLAADRPTEALSSFRKALDLCDRQLHRSVLKSLTADIDNAYLIVARKQLNDTARNDSSGRLVVDAARVFSRLRKPEKWLIDFSRYLYQTAFAELGANRTTNLAAVRIEIDCDWSERLDAAMKAASVAAAARVVANLAAEVDPTTASHVGALLRKIDALEAQSKIATALSKAGRLLSASQFEEALALLDGLTDAERAEPRFARIRILSLLGLGRFDAADEAFDAFEEKELDSFRGFVDRYPSMSFRSRLANAYVALKAGSLDDAETLMRKASPTSAAETAELLYGRAFTMALRGYRLQHDGLDRLARNHLTDALETLEQCLRFAEGNESKRYSALYDRVENDLERT